MSALVSALRRACRFLHEESGANTVLAIYFFLISAVVGGIAIDFNKLMVNRTRLQVTADSVAHAALQMRQTVSADEARTGAMTIAELMLPEGSHGRALVSSDIVFGRWDRDTAAFVADESSKDAVRVVAAETEDRGNAIRNLLLNTVGIPTFDAVRSSVFQGEDHPCYVEGLLAGGSIRVQGDVTMDETARHEGDVGSDSDDESADTMSHVHWGSGSDLTFDSDVCVQSGAYSELFGNGMLNNIIGDLAAVGGDYLPDFIDVQVAKKTIADEIGPEDLQQGAVNILRCHGNREIKLRTSTWRNMVIITDCRVKFDNQVTLENMMVITTSTARNSMIAAADLTIGRDDDCQPEGGAVLISNGGFHAAARLSIYGGQIIAGGDLRYAAKAAGFDGASLIAGGRIDGVGEIELGSCDGGGMENNVVVTHAVMRL